MLCLNHGGALILFCLFWWPLFFKIEGKTKNGFRWYGCIVLMLLWMANVCRHWTVAKMAIQLWIHFKGTGVYVVRGCYGISSSWRVANLATSTFALTVCFNSAPLEHSGFTDQHYLYSLTVLVDLFLYSVSVVLFFLSFRMWFQVVMCYHVGNHFVKWRNKQINGNGWWMFGVNAVKRQKAVEISKS